MNLRRVGILLKKEFVYSAKSVLFIIAVVTPLALTLVMSLLFGTLFSGRPTLGLVDEGASQTAGTLAGLNSLEVKEYPNAEELKRSVGAGTVDMGLVLPTGLDAQLVQGKPASLTAYVWGESLLKDRAILGAAITYAMRDATGAEAPVEIMTTTVGEDEPISWNERLLPVMVLMSIVMAGSLVPASSLVDEKQKRTLKALITTPASTGDVFLAKGLLGIIVSLGMGILILVLNQAFGSQPLLLVGILGLGATLAAAFGVLLGALMRDINTLFTTVKAIGILLYAPAIVYLFPAIPPWIGRLFPTYYMVAPVVEISLRGARWPDVMQEVLILIGLIVLLLGAVLLAGRRMREREV
jgi:ABC-2 type transport system permease protein